MAVVPSRACCRAQPGWSLIPADAVVLRQQGVEDSTLLTMHEVMLQVLPRSPT